MSVPAARAKWEIRCPRVSLTSLEIVQPGTGALSAAMENVCPVFSFIMSLPEKQPDVIIDRAYSSDAEVLDEQLGDVG